MICIFCKRPFEQAPPEHFIPTLVGGRDTISCVCKDCNTGVLARIDARIRENVQLSMAIDSSARGRYADIQHTGGSLHRKVTIVDGRTNSLKYDSRTPDGAVRPSSIRFTLRPEEDMRLSKVFAKIFLGTLAFRFGGDEVIEPRYDPLRE